MLKDTMLSEELTRSQMKEYLDESAKKLLGYRVICAYILKHCVKELSEYTVDYIAEKCILGDPLVSERPVHQHTALNSEIKNSGEKSEKIPEMKNEDSDLTEGTVTYDVIFEVLIPGETETIKLIINLEAQNAFNPGYPLVTRGFYYDARMISAQYGREFTNSEYGKIKKVYSIWICIDPDAEHRNTITRYHTTAENIFGNSESSEADYDKMEVILVGLQCDVEKESENSLIDMLSTLFSRTMKAAEKKSKLENRHGIRMKKEYSEVMEKMCNISDYYIPDYEVMQETMDKLIRAEDRADKAEDRADKAEDRADKAEDRADRAEDRADKAEDRAEKAESELEKYKARFGEIS